MLDRIIEDIEELYYRNRDDKKEIISRLNDKSWVLISIDTADDVHGDMDDICTRQATIYTFFKYKEEPVPNENK